MSLVRMHTNGHYVRTRSPQYEHDSMLWCTCGFRNVIIVLLGSASPGVVVVMCVCEGEGGGAQ